MNTLKIISYLIRILALVIIVFSFYLGSGISFYAQIPIYDGLRSTSAIIFAVMGAWIALLYPNQLSQAFPKKSHKKNKKLSKDIRRLFRPMIFSTFILIIVTGISFIVPLAKQIPHLHQYKDIFRGISFGIISTLTLLQFWSLLLTLMPADEIKENLDDSEENERYSKIMRPNKK